MIAEAKKRAQKGIYRTTPILRDSIRSSILGSCLHLQRYRPRPTAWVKLNKEGHKVLNPSGKSRIIDRQSTRTGLQALAVDKYIRTLRRSETPEVCPRRRRRSIREFAPNSDPQTPKSALFRKVGPVQHSWHHGLSASAGPIVLAHLY